MPYDEQFCDRIEPMIMMREGVSKKNMFGGIAFLINGNMSIGIWKDLLVVRLTKEKADEHLQKKNVRPMDITGKPMKGWIFVEPEGYKQDKDLWNWIEEGYEFANSLPPKQKK